MLIQKENLKGVYIWNKENVRIPFTGDASRRVFDRYNGDQMLFIINLYGLLSETFSIAKGIETENKIMSYMPLEIKSLSYNGLNKVMKSYQQLFRMYNFNRFCRYILQCESFDLTFIYENNFEFCPLAFDDRLF